MVYSEVQSYSSDTCRLILDYSGECVKSSVLSSHMQLGGSDSVARNCSIAHPNRLSNGAGAGQDLQCSASRVSEVRS